MTYASDVAATLSGATVRQLAYWRSSTGRPALLRPADYQHRSPVRYTFDDVVALRTIVYLRARGISLQKVRAAIEKLRDLGALEHPSRYRLVTVGQDVFWREGDAAVVLTGRNPGQEVLAEMVDILAPFERREGGQVLALERPVPGVRVDRDVLGGYPVIDGTRVPYAQVASLLADGVPVDAISRFYPSVTAEGAEGAARFAHLVARQGSERSA